MMKNRSGKECVPGIQPNFFKNKAFKEYPYRDEDCTFNSQVFKEAI